MCRNYIPAVGVRNINQWLVQITPRQTLESIKGVRKGTRYGELLASLEQQQVIAVSSLSVTCLAPTMGLWLTYPKIPLQPLLKNLLNIDVINPGSPTNETRDMLDTEYARWLPPLAGPNRQRPPSQRTGAPRVRTGQPERSARPRHRAAYAHMQRL